MEKRILLPRRALQAALIILLLGAAGMTKAGPVDVRTARQVGAKFINANTATRVASDQDLRLATTYRTSNGTAAFHVFNMSEGWVIVAADNCATPILAYSTSGQFDGNNLPPAMQNYLMGFVEQIGHGIDSHLPALDTVAHQWELVQATGLLRDDRSPATAVAPLLTTAWGTTYPYNSLCPADPNGYVGHVETGSPALAMGQIMRYWCYPFKGSGSHSYIPQNYPSQPQSVDFGNTIYDWDNMPNSLNSSSPAAQINAVATLLWHCGVSMNIDYSLMGCGAYPNDIVAAMRDYFNYSSDLHYDSQSDYTDSQWINKLKTDLDNGRPVLYSGLDTDNYYVHAFVCDGYNSSNQLHFNWGWNGTYQDAYFALGTLTPYPGFDFSASNHAIFEIHPNCTSGTTYQVSATAYPNNYGTVSGTGTYSCGNLCTLTATANPGYEFINWTKDGEVVSTNPTHNFAVTEGASFVANFAQEGIITFADANVKAICVTYWDTDDDGELSYAEAAVVTFLDEMFRGNGGITSFDELQYFTGMTSIESVFMDCSSLTSVVIPNSVTDIQFAFSGCSSLTSIEIPNSVNTIGDYAFENCYSLNSVIIGNSVTSIGVYAFYGCQDLTSITIPNSVEHIGDFAFYDCSNLASMTVLAVNPPTLATEALVGLNTQIPVYVPCESVGVYVNEAWGGFSNFIGLCAAGEITATADPAEGGTVTGAGSYAGGVICTLTATANEGYTFINWMENGQQVSTDPTYSFIVDGDASYVAKFAQGNVITFADAHVKALCVAHWDTDGDGELSYAEAAAVTDISGVFSLDPESSPGDPDVTSFDELQYFTGLTALGAFAFAGCSNLSSIIIPNSVTNLELYVFAGCSSLTTIEIPNSVDFIGGYAFADCSGLISVIIGNSVTTIGEFAFGSCSSLTSIEIPNSVTNIENDAFEGCIGLEQIDVESGNTVYDSRENCNAIIETTTNKLLTGCINTIIPNSVTSIEDDAFGGCNLTSITIPSSVTYIGYYAFANCQGLTSMTVLADTPPVLGADAFFHVNTQIPVYVPCWSVEEYVNAAWGDFINFIGLCTITFADANVKAICVENWDTDGDGELSYAEAAAVTNLNRVFKDNTTITSFDELQYFTGLTSLQVHEFSRCSSLSSIVIPDSVTTIGAWAFNHCTSLTSIVIPNSVTALDGGIVFSGSGLEQIIVESGNTVYDSRENCNAIIETSTNKLVVGCKNTVIPNSVTSIGTTAFSHCSGLTTIEIPNSVGSIGSSAFSSSGLTTIEIPNSVGSIGSYAFSDCSNLVSVEIPSSLGDIASYLFENCSSLSSIKIPNSVVYIDDHAFVNCSGMTSAIIGNSVANIGDGAFDYCSGLTSLTVLADQPPMLNSDSLFFFYFVNHDIPVYIPCGSEDNYTHSFWSDFNNFIELCSTITFADAQVKAICVENWDTDGDGELSYAEAAEVTDLNWAFEGNTEITSFDEMQYFTGLTSINEAEFYSCSSLTSITIPNFVTSIGYQAFAYCSSLSSIEIPNSVTSIKAKAFAYCSGLTSIEIPSSLISIIGNPFHGCSGLEQIIVESGNTMYDSRENCNAIIGTNTNTMVTGCKNTVIPNSVQYIGGAAFYGCSGLTSIEIPDAVTTIDFNAFSGCSSLTSVSIGNSMFHIGGGAFYNCSNLSLFTIHSENPPLLGDSVFYNVNAEIPVYVPCGSEMAYASASWGGFSNFIGACREITVTANPIEGGIVTGGGTYDYGTQVTLTATANEGYSFVNWTKNGEFFSGEETVSFIVTESADYVANFSINFYGVVVVAEPEEGGTVTGGGTYAHGQTCTLTATENPGYLFYNWTKDGAVVGDNPEYTFTVTDNANFVANFQQIEYYPWFTINPEEGGTAELVCDGVYGIVHYGDQVTIIATPNEGYNFVNWTVWGEEELVVLSTSPTYTFTMDENNFLADLYQNGEIEFIANFELQTFEIVVTANPVEGGTVEGGGIYAYGAAPHLLAVPNEGYTFTHWTLNGEHYDDDELIQPTVTGPAHYVAHFELQTYEVEVYASPEEGGTVTGDGSYTYGQTVTLTATPAEGYTFVNWMHYNQMQVSVSPTYSFIMTEETAGPYYAVFSQSDYVVTAVANPEEGGYVEGTGSYNHGDTCTLMAWPAEGYSFVNWTKNGEFFSGEETVSFIVTESADYVANFSINFYGVVVVAEPEEGGTVTGGGTYAHGQTCTLIATETPGYFFYNWTKDGVAVGEYYNPEYTFTVTDNANFVANFQQIEYYPWFTINPDEGGNTEVITEVEYALHYGDEVTIIATPNEGYYFVNWTTWDFSNLDDPIEVEISTEATYTFTVGEDNFGMWNPWGGEIELIANFEQQTFEIIVTADPVEGGTVEGGGTYAYGAAPHLLAVPNDGYIFTHWTLDGEHYDDDDLIQPTVTGPAHYVAHFVLNTRQITVSASPAEGGTVTGGGTYLYGEEVTLTATANPGYQFFRWMKDGGMVGDYYDPEYTFTVEEDANFVAQFEQIDYYIYTTADPEEGGEMTGEGTYHYGDQVTLTATPNEGFQFINWTFENEVVSTNATYTFTVNDQTAYSGGGETEYVAHFSQGPRQITVSANPVEGGTVTGGGTYDYGTQVTLIATEAPGYIFYNWTKDGVVVGEYYNPEYTFTVTDNANFVANFQQIEYYPYFTINPEEGGTAELVCDDVYGIVHYGDQITIIATPNEGYNFVNWTVWGEEELVVLSTSPTYTFTLDENNFLTSLYENNELELIANFELQTFEIVVTADPVEGGTVEGGGIYAYGAAPHLLAVPNEGYTFTHWTLDGEHYDDDELIQPTVTGPAHYVAHFEQISYEIMAYAIPEEGGVVTGSGNYVYGQTVTLTATANEGYTFVHWTRNQEQISTNATYSFIASEATADAYYAVFTNSGSYEVTVLANPSEGGVVTGSGIFAYGTSVVLTAMANEGYTFLYWAKNSELVSEETTYVFTLTEDSECVAYFAPEETDVQITRMSSGWTWYNTYIDQDGIDGLEMVKNYLGEDGIQIKAQQGYTSYFEGFGWMGTLTDLNNESSYKVQTLAPRMVNMIGEETTPDQHPITLNSGWNWIGYPLSTAMSVSEALSGITPTNGDQLKAQDDYANYYEGMGWMGTLMTIEPGMGLLYKSNNSQNITLVYPTGAKGETLTENITADNNHWVPDMHAYPDNMTVTAIIKLDDEELASDSYELAAFANGECRGSVRLMYIEQLDRYIAFLTITGEEVETLSFSLYDIQTGEEIRDAQETLNFTNNATVGDVRVPFTIHFRGTVGMDEWANSLQVFPNPVRRGENVTLGLAADEIGEAQVEIINALGQIETVRTTSLQTTIAAPSVAGVYTLRITVEGKGTCYRKLVVR